MNLVSVIIPYFKKKNFIVESVNSVINQSYKNLEIIIIYDDFSHKELDYILKLKDLDPRISIVINSKNVGAGESRNIGISKSNGKYIAFLDADDFWSLNKIELQIKYMQDNNLYCSHTSYNVVNIERVILAKRTAKFLRVTHLYDLLM